MLTLLLACTTPGTFEDTFGVPRKDLADCTATWSNEGGPYTRTHFDSQGYPASSEGVDTDGNWVEGLEFSMELDDQDRPGHGSTSDGENTWTEDWSYEGSTWRILEYTTERVGVSSTTWTWSWDGDTATVTDGGDCEQSGTLVDGLRFGGWDTTCEGELQSRSTLSWEDRLVHAELESFFGEESAVDEVDYSYDEDGRLVRQVHSTVGSDSVLDLAITWDCE